MKKLNQNPIHLYAGVPCAICDSDQPVPDYIEGCDWVQDKIIAERVNWEPEIIKPILRDLSDMTKEEALEVANLAWFAVGNKKIETVELKTTTLFPFVSIFFSYGHDDFYVWEKGEEILKQVPGNFAISLDNGQHAIKLYKIFVDNNGRERLESMPVYQSHQITWFLIRNGFNIGLLTEGSYIIRNRNEKNKDLHTG